MGALTRMSKEAWLAEAMADPEKEGAATMVSVVHRVGSSDEEVDTVHLNRGKSQTPKQVAERLVRKAEAYVQDMPGIQTFAFLVFYGGSNEPRARHPFTIAGKTDYGGLTEPATGSGPMQQHMRHSEASFALVLRQVDSNARNAEGLIDRLAVMNEQLMRDKLAMSDLFIKCLAQLEQAKTDRSLELIKAQQAADDRKKLWETAAMLANQVTGTEIVPQAAQDTAILRRIASTIDPADIQGSLMKDGPLVAALFGRLEALQKEALEEKRREQEALRIASGAANEQNLGLGQGDRTDKAAE